MPFGTANSWARPWVNLKLGVQYTAYTQPNGGSTNYDGLIGILYQNDDFGKAYLHGVQNILKGRHDLQVTSASYEVTDGHNDLGRDRGLQGWTT